jgi:hypothetical protein
MQDGQRQVRVPLAHHRAVVDRRRNHCCLFKQPAGAGSIPAPECQSPQDTLARITDVRATLKLNAPCSDGKLLKGTLHDVSSDPPGQAPPSLITSEFTAVLLSPGQN